MTAYRRAARIAVYFAIDGEVGLGAVVADARRRGKTIYAPVIAGTRLRFVAIGERGATTRNRYGIAEPTTGRTLDPRHLDLVLTPLVGFDDSGTRLGMGKGYYDRAFAWLRLRRRWVKPKLIGVAFASQQLAQIDRQYWDIPLWGAVTDAGIHYFQSRGTR